MIANLQCFLEVVSKPQIRFKGSRTVRDFAFNFIYINVLKRRRPIEKVVVPSVHEVCEHLSKVCNAAIGPQMGF